ncbi:MAG: hypothetical protein ACLU8F_00050 [Clostridia bacterium]
MASETKIGKLVIDLKIKTESLLTTFDTNDFRKMQIKIIKEWLYGY